MPSFWGVSIARSRKVPCRSVWNLRMYVHYGVTSQIAVLEPVMTMRINKKSSTLYSASENKSIVGIILVHDSAFFEAFIKRFLSQKI